MCKDCQQTLHPDGYAGAIDECRKTKDWTRQKPLSFRSIRQRIGSDLAGDLVAWQRTTRKLISHGVLAMFRSDTMTETNVAMIPLMYHPDSKAKFKILPGRGPVFVGDLSREERMDFELKKLQSNTKSRAVIVIQFHLIDSISHHKIARVPCGEVVVERQLFSHAYQALNSMGGSFEDMVERLNADTFWGRQSSRKTSLTASSRFAIH
ncbi:hypothetical protein SARC_15781 [Sphaeroforma arctica JP610]|uniref:Uncharacterized protein n=1 Tax=Sphaeroforma arctica JP610 TaxID=667725 RepID=A0A0L0F699_9EUKA|nr:hypothetical protein SARC_15781 [Sphaeroforma arctica JP610]KNC71678.1 hypothetical protein SARC_15781 [Sphaeroforma arctica JP610]|eukprot:XP_014145580.1 hypothetical protein SARC_15781 [Sphaeroforma arctica JP610]